METLSKLKPAEQIKPGDTVLVYCALFQDEPKEEKVKKVEGDWVYFEGDSGKIQAQYCFKPLIDGNI